MSSETLSIWISEKIEKYHQDNYYSLFPAGRVQPWVIDAVLKEIVLPMKGEIEELKAKLQDPELVK